MILAADNMATKPSSLTNTLLKPIERMLAMATLSSSEI
jgi:hypothetical protein